MLLTRQVAWDYLLGAQYVQRAGARPSAEEQGSPRATGWVGAAAAPQGSLDSHLVLAGTHHAASGMVFKSQALNCCSSDRRGRRKASLTGLLLGSTEKQGPCSA